MCFDLKVIYSNTVNWPAIRIQFYSVCLHGAKPHKWPKSNFSHIFGRITAQNLIVLLLTSLTHRPR